MLIVRPIYTAVLIKTVCVVQPFCIAGGATERCRASVFRPAGGESLCQVMRLAEGSTCVELQVERPPGFIQIVRRRTECELRNTGLRTLLLCL